MRVPDDVICRFCQGVFCCAKCRQKHEIKTHAIVVHKPIMPTENKDTECLNELKTDFEINYLFCPFCEKRPLKLQPALQNEMLLHIELHHLPLRCQKCFTIYNKINDLKKFSKCIRPNECHESLPSDQSCYTDEASKVTVTKAIMPHCMISHNSPLKRQDFNESHMTPISIINMRWKAKSKLTHEEFISDSVSSIKNISSISNSSIRHTNAMASAIEGKVLRCSSTPVHLEMIVAKPKEQTFNVTGNGQLSSIQNNSGCESDNSPAFAQPNSQALEPVNRNMKVAGSRPRMSAVTPLRQVMSKSIQKAFAKHGLPASRAAREYNASQRKNMFESTSSPEVSAEPSPQPPLDLRLSPAVRRSQSEREEFFKNQISYNQQKECNLRHEILLSAQKFTTESIVITRTEHLSSFSSSTSSATSMNSLKPYPRLTNSSNQSEESNNTYGSVFKSCSSVEIITATTEEIQQLQSFNGENVKRTVMSPLTPITRIPGAVIHKKIIKFETPKIESCDSRDFENSPDLFYTPNATPIQSNNQSDSAETKHRKLFVKKSLYEQFSPLQKPPIKEGMHSTAQRRVEKATNNFDKLDDIDDEVFLPLESENVSQKYNDKKEHKTQESKGLWSLVTAVMRLPSRSASNSKESYKNKPYSLIETNSKSLLKRCASIAGSLVRSKSLENENELSSLKRKRTYTTDNQSTLAYRSEVNNSEAITPLSDFNTSSKRFRIQGRRPIDRMRLNN